MSFATATSREVVIMNRHAFCRSLGIRLQDVIFMQQTHNSNVAIVTRQDAGRGAETPESAIPNTDALITQDSGVYLAGLGADCALVVLCDPIRRVVAMVHAGWRGTTKGVVEKTVLRMCSELGCEPGRIIAGIGPSIGPCCYEVGTEVLQAVISGRGAEAIIRRGLKLYLDIRLANLHQLLAQGISRENIEVADLCTACNSERFFSYRRDGADGGRFCGIIGMRE